MLRDPHIRPTIFSLVLCVPVLCLACGIGGPQGPYADARLLTLAQPVTGSVEVSRGHEAYRFEAGEAEVIRLRARPTAEPTLRPVIELFDDRGERLAAAGEGCARADVSMDFTIEDTGTYFLLLSLCGSRTGEYELALQRAN